MTHTNGDPMTTATPRDPDSFAWGDLCDIYGTCYGNGYGTGDGYGDGGLE